MTKQANSTTGNRGPTQDSGYKLLYSHIPMVRDLLQGFVPGAWVNELDLATLEKCSGSYVSDDLRDRTDDIVWRVRWGRDWLYVYLLLEFQSTIDPWMAVRIQTYLGLLYQDLIRTKHLSTAGLLPPVLPLVLYNGGTPWDAAQQLDHLIEPALPMLDPYQPRHSYFLIDELRVTTQGQLPDRNLSAALFRLEASRKPAEVIRIVRALLDWLKALEQAGLRRAFAVWFGRVFLPKRLPDIALDPMTDLFEVHHMLPEHVESWTDQWKREGLEQGLEQERQATRRLLMRLAHRRFGSETAGQAERLLAQITDPQQMEGLADLLPTCPDGAA